MWAGRAAGGCGGAQAQGRAPSRSLAPAAPGRDQPGHKPTQPRSRARQTSRPRGKLGNTGSVACRTSIRARSRQVAAGTPSRRPHYQRSRPAEPPAVRRAETILIEPGRAGRDQDERSVRPSASRESWSDRRASVRASARGDGGSSACEGPAVERCPATRSPRARGGNAAISPDRRAQRARVITGSPSDADGGSSQRRAVDEQIREITSAARPVTRARAESRFVTADETGPCPGSRRSVLPRRAVRASRERAE